MAGFREAKLSSNKKIKVQFFHGTKTEDLIFHLILNLKKPPATLLSILGRMMRHMKMKTFFMKS